MLLGDKRTHFFIFFIFYFFASFDNLLAYRLSNNESRPETISKITSYCKGLSQKENKIAIKKYVFFQIKDVIILNIAYILKASIPHLINEEDYSNNIKNKEQRYN